MSSAASTVLTYGNSSGLAGFAAGGQSAIGGHQGGEAGRGWRFGIGGEVPVEAGAVLAGDRGGAIHAGRIEADDVEAGQQVGRHLGHDVRQEVDT